MDYDYQQSANLGFRPAFFDFSTCAIYLSRDREGQPMDYHSYDGLPDEVVLKRWITGRVLRAKPTLIAGFERNGFFYTQASVARAANEWSLPNGMYSKEAEE